MSQEEEIHGKIEEQHRQGAHVTGPQAGCAICAALVEAKGDPISAEQAIEKLAAAARAGDVGRDGPGRPLRSMPDLPSVEEIQTWRRESGESGDETLGDVALQDAQQALDDLEALAKEGIIIPNEGQALAHATVGVVRALVGIEQQLERIADYLEPPSLPEGAAELMERVERIARNEDDPPAAA